jgi:hypothetical protein
MDRYRADTCRSKGNRRATAARATTADLARYLIASAGFSLADLLSLLCVLFLACVDALCPCDDFDL